MQHRSDRSVLPEELPNMSMQDALEAILRAHYFDVETLERLEAKHRALVDYIEKVTQ